TRPQARQQVIELGPDGLHVAERDAGGGQRDELPIQRVRVAVREADRIALATRGDVAAGADPVERVVDRGLPIAAHSSSPGGRRLLPRGSRFSAPMRWAGASSRRTLAMAIQRSFPLLVEAPAMYSPHSCSARVQ